MGGVKTRQGLQLLAAQDSSGIAVLFFRPKDDREISIAIVAVWSYIHRRPGLPQARTSRPRRAADDEDLTMSDFGSLEGRGGPSAIHPIVTAAAASEAWAFRASRTLVFSLTAVARPAAALSGAPDHSAGGQQADSRHPGRMCGRCSCWHQIDPVHNEFKFAAKIFT
jgi:hypothetical protein